VSQPEANAVFVHASDEILDAMHQRGWKFYTFIGGAARFMCSWDTKRARIDEFSKDLRLCAEQHAEPRAVQAR
jgi:threonine aldolase